jgi:hypothetical protein
MFMICSIFARILLGREWRGLFAIVKPKTARRRRSAMAARARALAGSRRGEGLPTRDLETSAS